MRTFPLQLPDQLVTSRLRLRPYRLDEASALLSMLSALTGQTRRDLPTQLAALKTGKCAEAYLRHCLLQWFTRQRYTLAITQRNDAELLGHLELTALDSTAAYEIGYLIGNSRQGQGFAKEALQAVVGFARKDLHAEVLLIRCCPDNIASIRVARACGFQPLPPTEPQLSATGINEGDGFLHFMHRLPPST